MVAVVINWERSLLPPDSGQLMTNQVCVTINRLQIIVVVAINKEPPLSPLSTPQWRASCQLEHHHLTWCYWL
jgi:hypothetical protein